MLIYNNNPKYGPSGPYDAGEQSFDRACDLFALEMRPSFNMWATEQEERYADDSRSNPGLPDLPPREERIAEMRREFLRGLEEVSE